MLPMQLFAEFIVVTTRRGCIYVDDHHWILAGAREYPSGVPSSIRFTRIILSHSLLPVGEFSLKLLMLMEEGYNDDATNNYYVGNYESPVQLAGQRYGYKLHKVPCETDFILSHNKRGFL